MQAGCLCVVAGLANGFRDPCWQSLVGGHRPLGHAAARGGAPLAWRRAGFAARIEADLALADQLADLVSDAPELELWHRPVTGVVNWRPGGVSAPAVQAQLQDAWVSTATIEGGHGFDPSPPTHTPTPSTSFE